MRRGEPVFNTIALNWFSFIYQGNYFFDVLIGCVIISVLIISISLTKPEEYLWLIEIGK
ncbi:MAG: hypothetical protein ACP5D6_10230 [Kosmotogaceae bacterium]